MPKNDLFLKTPIMNAAGTLGFSPDQRSPVVISKFGAFVSNPVSWSPRTPAKGERYKPFPGGFMLHTGYPNPGIKAVIRRHARRWVRSQVPVIVHLLAQDAGTLGRMVQRLETVEGLMGVEIGLPPDIDPDLAYEMVMVAVGELVVIVRVPFEAAVGITHQPHFLEAVTQSGVSAISLAPPRGAIPGPDNTLLTGRLYGTGIFPQALAAVAKLVEQGTPVIAAGGVYTQQDSDAMLAAGAVAVQLDAILWRGGFHP